MDDIWMRIVEDMGARVTGPMKLRLVLQPLMASVFAIRAGLKDARAGRPPSCRANAESCAHSAWACGMDCSANCCRNCKTLSGWSAILVASDSSA